MSRIVRLVPPLILLAILLNIPAIQAGMWLNIAHIQALRGNDNRAILALERASKLNSGDFHLRWRTGALLAEIGEEETAASRLSPLLQQPHWLRLRDPNIVIATLTEAGLDKEILHLYQSWNPLPRLSSENAATVALQYLEQRGQIPPARVQTLFEQTFDVFTARYQPLESKLFDTTSWSPATTRHVRHTLDWFSQDRASEIDSSVSQPEPQRVADILQIPAGNISFGEELVVNGGFEQLRDWQNWQDVPAGWDPSFMTSGDPWNRAAFIIGTDSHQKFSGNRSMRIDGLLIERKPELEKARAGFWHDPITVTSDTPYVITFVYRTNQEDDVKSSLYLSSEPKVLFRYDQSLPATYGVWKRVTIIAWNRQEADASIRPLLRSWSEGSVWFDEFSIRQVIIDPQVAVSPQKALTRISEAPQ
jgi:hypothetical protein